MILTRERFIIYFTLFVIYILTLIVLYYGAKNDWYKILKKPYSDPITFAILWTVAILVSACSIFYLQKISERNIKILTIMYMINSILNLFWSVVFFWTKKIELSILLSITLFIFNYTIFLFLMKIAMQAAILYIPLLILYAYLIYATIHLLLMNQ